MLRTAAQRRQLCRSCPVAKVANLVGDTCSLLIIRDLLETTRRFRDFEKSLKGVSTRTLAGKLKMLEREGIIKHTRGMYATTTKGRALDGVVESMRRYGRKYL